MVNHPPLKQNQNPMTSWININALIEEPDALRGLDQLIEYAHCVLDRNMRVPLRNADEQSAARTA